MNRLAVLNGSRQFSSGVQQNVENDENVVLTGECVNALQELTRGTVDEEFDLKLKLYETKDAFYEVKVDDRVNTTEEIEKLKQYVKKGQQMLKSEIIRYSTLKDKLDQSAEIEEIFQSQITQIKRSFLILDELNIARASYASELNHLHDSIDNFKANITKDFSESMKSVKDEYNQSLKTLVQLKDVYQVCRDSDLSYVCPICLQSRVECFMIPCGHTFCRECVKPTNSIRKICHICRNPYTRICTLYYA